MKLLLFRLIPQWFARRKPVGGREGRKEKNSLSLFLFLLFLIIFKTAFQFIHFFKSFFQKPFGCGLASVSRFTVNQHRKLLIQLSGSFSESLHVFPVGKYGMGDVSFSIFFSSPNIHELHVS